MPEFKKHPLAIAVAAWFESEEGQSCCDGQAAGVYLRNRLWRAFLAGAEAQASIEARKQETKTA